MKRYWLGIGLGALGVFVAGLLVYSAGRRGVHMVEETLASADPISIPLALVPFQLAGETIGKIRRVDVLRSSPQTITGADLSVRLDDPSGADRLAACRVIAEGLEHSGRPTAFRCFDEAADRSRAYVPFGRIHFEPVGLVQPLLVSTRDIDAWSAEIQHDGHRGMAVAPGAEAQEIVAQVQAKSGGVWINIWDALREAGFRLKADSSGAVLQITDEGGKSHLLLRADSHGVVVSAREGDSSRVELRADSNGFLLNVRDREHKQGTSSD